MKKNDVFTFTAPNGVEVTAVVIAELSSSYNEMDDSIYKEFLCYAQNRLFTYAETYRRENAFTEEETIFTTDKDYGEVLVDYAILPDYDELIQLHSSMEYPLWEQNLEAEIQGMNDR